MAIKNSLLESFFKKQKKASIDALINSQIVSFDKKNNMENKKKFTPSKNINLLKTFEKTTNKPLAKREQCVSNALAEPLAIREQCVSNALAIKKQSVSKASTLR